MLSALPGATYETGCPQSLGEVVPQARTPNDLAGAFQALADQRSDAAIVLQTSMLLRSAENHGAGSSDADADRLWLNSSGAACAARSFFVAEESIEGALTARAEGAQRPARSNIGST